MLKLEFNQKNWSKMCTWVAGIRAREERTNARLEIMLHMINQLLKEKGWPEVTMEEIDRKTRNDEDSINGRTVDHFDLPDDIFPDNP